MPPQAEMEIKITPQEIRQVTDYMMCYHCGYQKAAPRKQIANNLNIEDRHFRAICAEIPEILGSVHYGYWILPLMDTTGTEAHIAREVLNGEDRRRMIALYLRYRRQRTAVKRMQDAERQLEMAGV